MSRPVSTRRPTRSVQSAGSVPTSIDPSYAGESKLNTTESIVRAPDRSKCTATASNRRKVCTPKPRVPAAARIHELWWAVVSVTRTCGRVDRPGRHPLLASDLKAFDGAIVLPLTAIEVALRLGPRNPSDMPPGAPGVQVS